ncbi:cytochrome c [Cereibacter sphaeroides]|uniref:c-type cytochrome n=1 Tax=Cereibacter sphaeroides TaxID=1063 RepID=UPI001F160584|nr:cytochrome c [Cereibacter sphaeroides]MCE6962163.1 cytochrome c [Cereibacter sphaeroides]MCE6972106.1 cytochrome c [Cereibacter sphaeroides]
MRRMLALGLAVAAMAAAGLWITRPERSDAAALADLAGDATRGERVFWAGGCASCHAAPGSRDEARLVLAGGVRLSTAFGTFVAPNISPHPTHGIGGWSLADLDSALRHGTSPEGRHYYPSFPWTSYAHATPQDVADLKAFLDTLPPSDRPNEPHELSFPFDQRLLLGGWKLLAGETRWLVKGELTPEEERGRYLVEGLGHCGECHTPRDGIGRRETARWLAGGPNPEGRGTIPNITPAKLDWSATDIAEYLSSGFTPDYDSAGGQMADVIRNTSQLPDEDRRAIAAYLKRVPPVE